MRAGVRIATDYVLRWTVTALRKHDGDILEALVLACLSCADTPILGAEHGLRPLRINQVAASVQRRGRRGHETGLAATADSGASS